MERAGGGGPREHPAPRVLVGRAVVGPPGPLPGPLWQGVAWRGLGGLCWACGGSWAARSRGPHAEAVGPWPLKGKGRPVGASKPWKVGRGRGAGLPKGEAELGWAGMEK